MKTSALALSALLLAGGLSVPAFAASYNSTFDSDFLVKQLQDRGVNAVDAFEKTDNVIRVEVKLADGSSQWQYFYQDTLTPVKSGAQTSTRVLSKVDTGARKAPVENNSLLVDNFFD